MLLIVVFFSLQYKPVQTYIAKKTANYLSTELNTKVYVGGLHIKPFKSLVLDTLYVQDREKDTLLFSPKFTVDLNFISLKLRKLSVKSVQMDNGKIYLKKYKDKTTNLAFIIDYFNAGKKTVKKNTSKPFDLILNKIVLNNIAFKYKNLNNTKSVNGINFNDIYLRNFSSTILDLDTKKHLVSFGLKNMTFKEKSGFYLKNLTTNATIDSNQMEFKNLLLETPDSKVRNYLLFKYSKFKDFRQFISKVYLKSDLRNTKVNSSDIAYFSPNLAKSSVIFQLNGKVSGYVNNLKAKDLTIQSGQASYVKGNFSIKGLPSIKETLLDLDFEQISTNKKDIDFILARARGSKKSIIPEFANQLGTINFKGRLTGFINNFKTIGEFKTKAGRLLTDINLKIDKNSIPTYSGTLKAFDFNIGEVLGRSDLGRTTLSTTISGTGFKIKSLQEKIKSELKYLDYNGYRYSNINVEGNFINNIFNGQIKVDDSNLELDFDGNINLNPQRPIYNFHAMIRGANLHKLNFMKDTIQFDAELKTNFSGSNLENIEGSVELSKIQLTNPKNSFIVDSVNLKAIGTGSQRSLIIGSDILDASIKGQYDLKALPSYFKSVASRYIPSLGLKFGKPGQQNFEFNLNIKF